MPSVAQIAEFLESWAPPGTAQSYDNVGLQVGRSEREVRACVIALDMTPDVLAEAQEVGAELIITHHPLLFRPLSRVTASGLVSELALSLAESRIALYSIHTNLDAARGGVSFALAESLGVGDIEFLGGLPDTVTKLVTFVPLGHEDAVRGALARAGAGRIGAYEACSFSSPGTGRFRPTPDADPFIGAAGGDEESVTEIRIEMEVARHRMNHVLHALREAHPYEEPAYDLIPVDQPMRDAGLGAIGTLPAAITLSEFLERVCSVLGNDAVRYAGDPQAPVQRVAVCGGSGSDFLDLAMEAGADVYVTSDVTYHRYFDLLRADSSFRMALVDPGHYESERVTEELLRDRLAQQFPDTEWIRTATRTAPVKTWVSGSGSG